MKDPPFWRLPPTSVLFFCLAWACLLHCYLTSDHIDTTLKWYESVHVLKYLAYLSVSSPESLGRVESTTLYCRRVASLLKARSPHSSKQSRWPSVLDYICFAHISISTCVLPGYKHLRLYTVVPLAVCAAWCIGRKLCSHTRVW